MSKRRNPKKEKALRNKAYARRFRKALSGGRFFRNKRYGNNRPPGSDRDEDSSGEESSNAKVD
jgi:hypothetical protein